MADQDKPNIVKLGDEEYKLVAQPIALIWDVEDRYGDLGKLVSEALEQRDPKRLLDDSYELFSLLIPELVPEHRFFGFATEELYRRRRAGEKVSPDARESAPTVPQLKMALRKVSQVNGLDIYGALKQLFNPRQLGTLLVELPLMLPQAIEAIRESGMSGLNSLSLSSPNGPVSDSTEFSPESPMLEESSEDSPSPDSNGSSPPTSAATSQSSES